MTSRLDPFMAEQCMNELGALVSGRKLVPLLVITVHHPQLSWPRYRSNHQTHLTGLVRVVEGAGSLAKLSKSSEKSLQSHLSPTCSTMGKSDFHGLEHISMTTWSLVIAMQNLVWDLIELAWSVRFSDPQALITEPGSQNQHSSKSPRWFPGALGS